MRKYRHASIMARLAGIIAAAAFGLSVGVTAPGAALADDGPSKPSTDSQEQQTGTVGKDGTPDLMIGVFTNSANDSTDSVFMSTDGINFQKIAEPFTDATPNDSSNLETTLSYKDGRSWPIYTMSCPSIIWHNGYFWIVGNEPTSGDDHTLRINVSYSKDLEHWSDPLSTKIPMPKDVPANGFVKNQFDAVAADWAVAPDGTVDIVVSIGSYGGFHGSPQADEMYPYLLQVSELSAKNDPAKDPLKNDYTLKTSSIQRINLPKKSTNRIDGSLYFENGSAYLSIKRDGVTNEIWQADQKLANVGQSSAWKSIADNVVTGREAPSLTKYNGKYFYYTDELADWTPGWADKRQPNYITGTGVQTSTSLAKGWTQPQHIQAIGADGRNYTVDLKDNRDADGPTHGTVTVVTDPAAKKLMRERWKASGWESPKPVQPIQPAKPEPAKPLFTDVTSATPHAIEIGWLAGAGITKGYGDGTFGGMRPVVRQDMAAFLYRLAGSPAFDEKAALKKHPFTDVDAGTPHYKEILWLASTGIAKGYTQKDAKTGKTVVTFGGMRTVVRQDMAAFLHRFATMMKAKPKLGSSTVFSDVTAASPHAFDIVWLARAGVSTGYPDGTFGGMRTVVRQDMAAFLYRMNGNVLGK